MDWAAVRIHTAQYCNRFKIGDVPNKHHPITVEGNGSIIEAIYCCSDHIRKFS